MRCSDDERESSEWSELVCWLWRSLGWYEHWATLHFLVMDRWMWLNVKELLSMDQSLELVTLEKPADTNKWATMDLFVICDQMNEWWEKRMISSCTYRNVFVRFQYLKWIYQTLDDKNAERRRESMGRLSEYLNCNDWHRFQFANHNCGEHRLFCPF